MKKNLYIVLLIIIFGVLSAESCKDKYKDLSIVGLEIPAGSSNQVIVHYAYTLSYNEEHEQADWVAYELTVEEVENDTVPRENNFRPDPDVDTESATHSDYTGSGYDRGHLAPAADMKWDITAMSESFFMSNISPQLHSFNGGKWLYLEKQVRDWAKKYDGVYVAVGGILTNDLDKIPETDISIPKYFYKVILDSKKQKAIGFIMPNISIKDSLQNYAMSIDEVEERTGLDFFEQLPDDIEDDIESNFDISEWHFKYY